jgi:general secretion pathway protein E
MSTMPGLYGETVALRLLNQTRGPPPLDALEIPAHLIGPWRDAMRISHGLVLVTGPTGSGKTTTIAASLREIADGDRHIITIEDPIEYRIEGLNQKQVRPEFGMTFAHTLRAALRHDPDVIVVGEIRDAETASVALQAATTGHLVISTLHTASACGAITRLLNLGVPLHMLRNNLHTVMAQRLVRRCCPTCRHTAPAVKKCPDCGGTGFHGRRSVLELLTLSEPLWKEFGNSQNDAEVEAIAMRQGFMTMGQMGDVLVKMGETTQSELRLAGVQRAA